MAANKAKADKDGLKTLKDWNQSKVILTIKRGTAPGETVARLFPQAKLRQFDDDAQALQDVLNGNAHGFLTSEPKPTHYVLDNPKVLYHPFGVGPGSHRLVDCGEEGRFRRHQLPRQLDHLSRARRLAGTDTRQVVQDA